MAHFKFIHAADLHIESPYQGMSQLNQALGEALVNQGINAYDTLIQMALREAIDFLIISGDSFDSEAGSLSAQYRFIKGLKKLDEADIPVYLICGNHDPLESWPTHFQLPKNVTLFEADKVQQTTFKRNDEALAEIYGVSFGKKEEYRRLAANFHRNDTTSFSIAILHGTLAGNNSHTPYCPFDLDTLKASNMDYWALGHIHKREIVHPNNPTVIYPGNIQGRHFNETGEKGCYLIEVDKGKVTHKTFVKLSNIIYEYVDIQADDMETTSDLLSAINQLKDEKKGTKDGYLLRIRLKGKTPLHSLFANLIELQNLIDEINGDIDYATSFVYLDKIINETLPVIDIEEIKNSSDFLADLIQQFETLEEDEEQAKEIIQAVAEEIASSKVGRKLTQIDALKAIKEDASSLLKAAKWKALDGLESAKRK